VVAAKTNPFDAKEHAMTTKKSCAMLMLAMVAAVSFSATVMAQGTSSTRIQPIQRTALGKRAPFLNPQSPADVRFLESLRDMSMKKRWMIGANRTGYVVPKINRGGTANGEYNLKGKDVRKFLHYKKHVVAPFGPNAGRRGIDVGWTKNASASTATKRAQWSFRRQFDQAEAVPLVYGERLSLAWGRGKKPYVKYESKSSNSLFWSSKPALEWAILGGKPGTRVKRGQDWVILFNLKYKRPLKYYDRKFGGDIGWGEREDDSIIKPLLTAGSYY
jgi:hypothetical protein